MQTIHYTIECLSPVHHGGFGDTGNVRTFRRETILVDGERVDVPVISGGAIRGRIRREVVREMLAACGLDRTTLPARQWDRLYGALANGGTLDGSEDRIDPAAVRALRGAIPPLSAMGAALYSGMIAARCRATHAVLVCEETARALHVGAAGAVTPADELVADWSSARLPDGEEQDTEASGVGPMPSTIEVVIRGATFQGAIRGGTPLEASCMAHGLDLIGTIGGKSAAGFGEVLFTHDGDGSAWVAWLAEHREELRASLIALAERLAPPPKAKKGKAKPADEQAAT